MADQTNKDQLERFKQAVEDKNEAAEAAADAGPQNPGGSEVEGDQQSLVDAATPQDVQDPRAKNTGKRKKTADKWNQ